MKVIITLGLSMLLFSCHRHTMPQVTSEIKDSVVYKVVPHDTTIYIPGATVEVVKTAPCPEWNFDTVATNGNVKLHVNITNGHLTANCKADSLQKVITLLNTAMEKYHNQVKTVTVTVTKNVPVNHVPKWAWWSLASALGLAGWTFKKPIGALIKTLIP